MLYSNTIQNLLQMLEKQSKSPSSEDAAFARNAEVAIRNRYKDKFPCELGKTMSLLYNVRYIIRLSNDCLPFTSALTNFINTQQIPPTSCIYHSTLKAMELTTSTQLLSM